MAAKAYNTVGGGYVYGTIDRSGKNRQNEDLTVSTGNSYESNEMTNILSTSTNGIEGLPYQFMNTVDRRIDGTDVGRKYGEKIYSHLPLLFLTPCEPLFMADFDNVDRATGISALLGDTESVRAIATGGKFYSMEFAYQEYYKYVNTMLACVSGFLFNDNMPVVNGKKLNTIDWSGEGNDSFKSFFSAKENVIYYVDGFTSVDESFSNETGQSSLASTINQYSEMANEIRFLFGSSGSVAASLIEAGTEVTSTISSSLSGVASALGGGIIGSLTDKGVNSALNGGKIIFPKIWSDSSFDKSYSFTIKLRSPDHDRLSIFMNVLKPYCKLLCMVLPRQLSNQDPNAYGAPFLVKANIKGMANIDMGMITSMSVTRGADCQWNDDGLPTQIDITISIEDLYSSLMITDAFGNGINAASSALAVVTNTSLMDFLANMSGLNIAQMEVGRRIQMYKYLTGEVFGTAGSTIYTGIEQKISSAIGQLYNIL